MAIKNYTTQVNMHRTVAEIQGVLGAKGAKFVSVEYSDGGDPVAVKFGLVVNGNPIPFRLPCNVAGVFRALQKSRRQPKWQQTTAQERSDREKAPHVAWRIVKDWVEAQMALVEAEQAQLAEVFLPYTVDTNGKTMFEWFVESRCPALPAGSEPEKEEVTA